MSFCDLPYSDDLEILRTPLKVNNRTIPNRIVYQPMEGCDSVPATGEPSDLTIRRYDRFAEGGAGLIWFEAVAVQVPGRANPRQLFLTKENSDHFKRILERIKETCIKVNGYEPVVIMQLTHSGRYSKPNGVPEPLIAYNKPIFEGDKPISADRILSDEQIDRVREDFIKCAALAETLGFDGADIKSCHGYLNSELFASFLRPGKYGGSFENRTRLMRESIQGAIAATGSDFIITARMNAYDGFPHPYGFGVREGEGLTPYMDEAIKLILLLESYGVPLINITMGNPYVNPHVNRPFTKGGYESPEEPIEGVKRVLSGIREIQSAVSIPVISSALTYLGEKSPGVAAACIKEGWFALAGYGRMTFSYPDIARDIVLGNEFNKKKNCITCSKCSQLMRAGGTPGCIVRDAEVYAPLFKEFVK